MLKPDLNCVLLSAVAVVLSMAGVSKVDADELRVSAAASIANGAMTVMHPADADPATLLIHFHGSPEAVREVFERSELKCILAVVNFPGLSTAYSKPFAEDHKLFDRILSQARAMAVGVQPASQGEWSRIAVSSFSAGYGAVREILKTPENMARIDSITTADSIYAGLQEDVSERLVDEANMQGFLEFASLAVSDRKRFVLSHSAQPTPYASTTETADYLLRSLGMARTADESLSIEEFHQTSRAAKGGFLVLGFEGVSAQAHMQHLHHLDLFWRQVSSLAPAP
ncbi:hypothetical protein [Aureliella helgolandensis]|uniref:Alpha/beta hydrolase family protein n=1 Tax=Aureliella helgolandensis TaxID=2527968 RepID=A0A518G1N6_9BACT|nr:hypothetical protein [Aureliella helgolandensis]QDV22450.1 hypothetical protein Q31a_07350 [Aureliella helgolandensis]